jgi:hypothetical protein
VLVVTVIVVVAGAVPLMVTLAELKEQVGSSLAPEGADVIVHFRLTWPVKFPVGVTVTVELLDAPRLAIETSVPESVKPAGVVGSVTVTTTLVVAAVFPFDVAVMVSV